MSYGMFRELKSMKDFPLETAISAPERRKISEQHLMSDIADLAHDVEWYDSGDICEETYRKSVAKFKKKWFGTDRTDRLIGYVDTKLDEVKRDLYRMIIPERDLKDMR